MNDLGLKLLKSFEGCRLTGYKDQVGKLTIGWGHTGAEVVEGLVWTQEQCDEQLVADLAKFEQEVLDLLEITLNDDQISALVDFTYNFGAKRLGTSTLLMRVNSGDFELAHGEFLRWDHEGAKEVEGLLNRRKAEASLFDGDYAAVDDILAKRS